MQQTTYLADASVLSDAHALVALFGQGAGLEADLRADRSRDLGNVHHFCRWRQVGLLVDMMQGADVTGTRH